LEYSYHFSQEEAEICVAGAATTEEQSAETVREEELEQTLKLPKQKREEK
jgi:hypothetical protein